VAIRSKKFDNQLVVIIIIYVILDLLLPGDELAATIKEMNTCAVDLIRCRLGPIRKLV
jgi:hypothetical protein